MRRVIICGSRKFNNYELLKSTLEDYFKDGTSEVIIVSGHAKGADDLGEQYADWKKIPVEQYPADWDRYGKQAGMMRNLEMADVADECIAFIAKDAESKGTKNMISIMKRKGKKVTIIDENHV